MCNFLLGWMGRRCRSAPIDRWLTAARNVETVIKNERISMSGSVNIFIIHPIHLSAARRHSPPTANRNWQYSEFVWLCVAWKRTRPSKWVVCACVGRHRPHLHIPMQIDNIFQSWLLIMYCCHWLFPARLSLLLSVKSMLDITYTVIEYSTGVHCRFGSPVFIRYTQFHRQLLENYALSTDLLRIVCESPVYYVGQSE